MPFELTIDAEDLEDIVRAVGATEAQAVRALKRAGRHAARWTGTRVVRRVSKSTKIQQKVLRTRRGKAHGNAAGVWFGLNPVGVGRLKPRQNRRGVRAGGQQYDGAFVRSKGAGPVVYKRRGADRLPIEALRLPIYRQGLNAAEDLRNDAAIEFVREFERLLKVELNGGF